MNNLRINYSTDGVLVKATLQGAFTQLDAINLKNELPEKINEEEKLVVDLTDITDIDLTGVNTLLTTNLKLSLKNVIMTLKIDNNNMIQKLLQISNTSNQFIFE